jgi:uncharacterized protein (TIGR03086 family)
MDMIEMYDRSLARTGTVVAGVDRERFSDPTPCDDWDVEKLLDHIIGGCLTFAGGGSGSPVDAMQERGFATKDHVTAYQEAAASALETFRAPGALEGTLTLPWGDTPGPAALGLALADAVVHGWDLAVATDQKAEIDEDVAEAVYEMTSSMMAPKGDFPRMTAFKDPIEVDDDAPAQVRMLAYLGRSPANG